MTDRPLVIWRFLDGKAGHQNQTRGLLAALAQRTPVQVHDIPAPARLTALWTLLSGRYPETASLPAPDLILGAGHATHLGLLAARRAWGGRAIVLMKPSLPTRLFDLCLVPQHDSISPGPHVALTRGAINACRPASAGRDPGLGLILIGGPSPHYRWDPAALRQQLAELLERDPETHWLIGDSRRTPPGFSQELRALATGRVGFHSHTDTPPDWIGAQMASAGQVWISPDSVSMVYEALSSGAPTGLLELPPQAHSRIPASLAQLADEDMLTTWQAWRDGAPPREPAETLDEAGRCAELLLERYFAGRKAA